MNVDEQPHALARKCKLFSISDSVLNSSAQGNRKGIAGYETYSEPREASIKGVVERKKRTRIA